MRGGLKARGDGAGAKMGLRGFFRAEVGGVADTLEARTVFYTPLEIGPSALGAFDILPRSLHSAAGAHKNERRKKPVAPVGMTEKEGPAVMSELKLRPPREERWRGELAATPTPA